ncbi:temptin [Biomphalaria pfeifferi]|uniref:Temptin n=1 Tax=Biomphalaria pfeifferi TaxID=112525 RepID=A0AAD8BEH0_BIOPF|nr:temptin [Biomphalaria pfeifferi]
MTMLAFTFLACLLMTVSAFITYQDLIPNGSIVPNPCRIGLWPAVGHLTAEGGTLRNTFGADFAAAGHTWTVALCQRDSDRDGVSNGAELGDPNCRFVPNFGGSLTAPQRHPGICEPIGSAACAWQNFSCPPIVPSPPFKQL